MKKKFLDWSMNIIKKNYPDYDDDKLAEIKYGLEGFYLTITKLLIIFPIAIITGNFFYMLILLICFNILRKTGFGVHATTSLNCLISSTIIFIGVPYICKFITISLFYKCIISIISIISLYLYAPADTKKRPLINRKRCLKYKYITIINACTISIVSMLVTNNTLSNIFLMSVVLEGISVNKLTYKIFNLPFDNYKQYNMSIKQNA